MINAEYACAYKEVIELLKYMPIEDVKKIPSKKILYLLNHMDKHYEYIVDETKTFEEQKKSALTESIFADFFRNYWTTPAQKERILAKINYDFLKMEEKKRELYNPNAIFQTKKKKTNITATTKPMQYQSESFWHKILNRIKQFFQKF